MINCSQQQPAAGSLTPTHPARRYALITPARNEEALIEATIRSVIAQTIHPVRWVMVSDGSTDRTDDIARAYAGKHDWIELLRLPERRERHFAAKANAFNAGYGRLRGIEYDYVANLDADITFGPDYFEFLLAQFESNPRLGVAGTPFVENSARPDQHSYAHKNANLNHVSGACQVFRRVCFDQVGGYVPVKGGAIDWIAVTTARMKGWQTRTFTEQVCHHHRALGTGNQRAWLVPFHYGRKAYYVGGHPLWALLRTVFWMKDTPYVVGGLLFLAGFSWSTAMRRPRVVSQELMEFHRYEQMARFRQVLEAFTPRLSRTDAHRQC